MKRKQAIFHAMIWAALMIVSAFLITDKSNAMMMQSLLIAGWFASDKFIQSRRSSESNSSCC